MRIIICGTRGTSEKFKESLFEELNELESDSGYVTVIHGDCPGSPDKWAEEWVNLWLGRRSFQRFPAQWEKYGKVAGIYRNLGMAENGADYCVAVWNGTSKGTLNMIQEATVHGIPVRIIPTNGKVHEKTAESEKTS